MDFFGSYPYDWEYECIKRYKDILRKSTPKDYGEYLQRKRRKKKRRKTP